MKIKKSKHVHHDRGYTPVVNCKLTSRRLVCGTETDIQGVAVAVAHPQKVDIEQMAHDISHATTATPTDVKFVWDALRTAITDALSHGYRVQLDDYVAHGEMERVPRVNGCFRPTKGNFGR